MDEITMIQTLVEQYGLFVALVVYTIWENRQREKKWIERENKYISVIDKLGDGFDSIKRDVETIKTKLWGDK